MIAKRIDRDVANDNYRALALYAADAGIGGIQGEKTFHSWYAGGEAATYLEGLIEVEATQALNSRAAEEKTYHLMVSFRPEDEPKLSKEVLEDIERIYAEALGFADHQRHCGVHVNTDNWHLHIAYNRINPRTFNSHHPFYDFPKLSRASRTVEQKYGLAVDNGMEPGSPRQDGQASARVKTLEVQSGQESLFSFIIRQKPALMALLAEAGNWAEVHTAFLQHGLLLKPSGNGLTIKDRYGKHSAKASDIDRSLGKAQLTARFGSFIETDAELLRAVKSAVTYTAAPLHLGSGRDDLYALFQAEMSRRRETLRQISDDSSRLYTDCRSRWDKKRRAVERIPLLRHDRRRIRLELKKREQAELDTLRADTSARRKAIREEIPYATWAKYLQHLAAQGNETALAILRSRKEVVQPELINQPSDNNVPFPQPNQIHQTLKNEIAQAHGLTNKTRQALLAVVKMREVLEAAPEQSGCGFKYTIDTKGTIIFRLADGRTIRDTGQAIHYSSHHDEVKDLALKYAAARWRRALVNQDGVIQRSPGTAHIKVHKNINTSKR
jgi:hypothetical protein